MPLSVVVDSRNSCGEKSPGREKVGMYDKMG